MSGSARVLTGLMERRALEAAFTALSKTTTLDQLAERAEEVAGYGNAALPILISLLDTADPQLRGGLGQVAARLDAAQVIPALRAVARARDRSDQARLTALMILDRFLHQPVEEALLAGLQDPDTVAAQSLRELVHEMDRSPFVVVEYLNQLAEQPADVARTVLDAIPGQPAHPHLVTLLRMFAQGEDRLIAQAALEQLSRTRSAEAAHALWCLSATLPPQPAALAKRSLRKLALSGVPAPAIPADRASVRWRALISPVDGVGAQVIWFVGAREGSDHGLLFSILNRDPDGIVASFGSFDVPLAELPPAQPLGSRYVVQQAEDGAPILLLEAPLAAARQAVWEGLDQNWAAGHAPPMEYRLLNPLIWEQMAGQTGEAESGSMRDRESVSVGAAAVPLLYSPMQTAALLDHPAFGNWFCQAPELYDAVQQLGRRCSLPIRVAQIQELAGAQFGPDVVKSYQRRLEAMARWLTLAFEPEPAALARSAAAQLSAAAPADLPFVRRLIGTGLDVALANLRSGYDLRKHAASAS